MLQTEQIPSVGSILVPGSNEDTGLLSWVQTWSQILEHEERLEVMERVMSASDVLELACLLGNFAVGVRENKQTVMQGRVW